MTCMERNLSPFWGKVPRMQGDTARRVILFSAISAISAVSSLIGQTPPPAEWRSYAGDLRNHHYSPLAQVTADNLNALEVAWRFKTDSLGQRPEYKLEGTP